MTLKDIAKQLTTAVQTVPNLVQILRDGLEQATAGSSVEVTQVVSSGTKIASVKVDNETTDLYAPDGKINYSETEQNTGLKWIDGKDIYVKTISGTSTTDTGISKEYAIVKMDTLYEYNVSDSAFIGNGAYMGISSTGSANPLLYIEKGTTNYEITRGGSGTYSKCEIIIYYTK